jgi:FKBP-type peptidyl-prolyl cis-trans isomerase (trigger factor)
MAVNVETLGTLERRLSMSVPAAEVERQVDELEAVEFPGMYG